MYFYITFVLYQLRTISYANLLLNKVKNMIINPFVANDCLFDLFRPTQEFFTDMETSSLNDEGC